MTNKACKEHLRLAPPSCPGEGEGHAGVLSSMQSSVLYTVYNTMLVGGAGVCFRNTSRVCVRMQWTTAARLTDLASPVRSL